MMRCLCTQRSKNKISCRRKKKKPLLMLGLIIALVAYVPVIGLLTPSLAALAYVHYCLEALRQLRQGAVVAVIQSAKQE